MAHSEEYFRHSMRRACIWNAEAIRQMQLQLEHVQHLHYNADEADIMTGREAAWGKQITELRNAIAAANRAHVYYNTFGQEAKADGK